ATLSRDSCWITSTPASSRRGIGPAGSSYLLGLLQDLGHAPPLGGRERPGFHQQYTVADAALVLRVVCHVLLGTAQDLAVLGVLYAVLNGDDDGRVHLVALPQPLADLAVPAVLSVISQHSVLGHFGALVAHLSASSTSTTSVMMPSSRSRITV